MDARKLKSARIANLHGCSKSCGAKNRGRENKRRAKIKGSKGIRLYLYDYTFIFMIKILFFYD